MASKDVVVFVIGAGASKPFGLPTGSELLESIVNSSPLRHARSDYVVEEEYDNLYLDSRAEALRFSKCLRKSGVSSVDRYLERNSVEEPYGKVAIVKAVHGLELDVLRNGNVASNWHSWLIERLCDRWDDLLSGQFRFIVFNYDRLLFGAFYTMIAHREPTWAHEKVLECVNRIPIVHVYGRFNYPLEEYLRTDNWEQRPLDWGSMQKCAEGIRIISDSRGVSTQELLQCKDWIQASSQVVFLGFGFDKINTTRIGAIGIANLWYRRQVYVNAFDLEDAEQRRVVELLGGETRVGTRGHDCLRFLRHSVADWIE